MFRSGAGREEMTGEAGFFESVPLKALGEWDSTGFRPCGELAKDRSPAAAGRRCNVVITTWEWGNEKTHMHDLIFAWIGAT